MRALVWLPIACIAATAACGSTPDAGDAPPTVAAAEPSASTVTPATTTSTTIARFTSSAAVSTTSDLLGIDAADSSTTAPSTSIAPSESSGSSSAAGSSGASPEDAPVHEPSPVPESSPVHESSPVTAPDPAPTTTAAADVTVADAVVGGALVPAFFAFDVSDPGPCPEPSEADAAAQPAAPAEVTLRWEVIGTESVDVAIGDVGAVYRAALPPAGSLTVAHQCPGPTSYFVVAENPDGRSVMEASR
ncbi:MAG: hypothetical protein HKN44_02510 [Ilumatobacter sp.]|nr:hypothetical protein [Ilumatobacter sp.]